MKQLQVNQQLVARFVLLFSVFLLQILNPNVTDFCCGICCLDYPYDQAFKLTQCSHHVCKLCLRAAIKLNTDPEIRCPYANTYVACASYLTHSEIKKLTTADEYKWFEQIGIKVLIEADRSGRSVQ